MGIWLLLDRLSEEQLQLFAKDTAALKAFLNRERDPGGELPDRHDTDKSFEPLYYLITGRRGDDAGGTGWKPPTITIRLENTTGRHNKFYEIVCEGYHTTIRFGQIHSLNDTFDVRAAAGVFSPLWMIAQSMPGQFGLGGSEFHSSRKALLTYIFSTLQEKLSNGYKIKFKNPLPPPVCPDVPTAQPAAQKGRRAPKKAGATRGTKRAAPTPATTQEPVRRSKRARKETQKAREHREDQDAEEKEREEEEKQEEKKEAEKQEEKKEEAEKEQEVEKEKEREAGAAKEGEEEKEGAKESGEKEKDVEMKDAVAASIELPWKLKLGDLKAELEARSLPTDGKKDVLVARLCMVLLGLELPTSDYVPPEFDPCDYLMAGGTELGDDKLFSYGPARGLSAAQTKEFSDALQKVTEEDLKKRYDPKKMESQAIGPPNFYGDEQGTWDYLLLHFNSLKKFLLETVEKGMGVMLYLS